MFNIVERNRNITSVSLGGNPTILNHILVEIYSSRRDIEEVSINFYGVDSLDETLKSLSSASISLKKLSPNFKKLPTWGELRKTYETLGSSLKKLKTVGPHNGEVHWRTSECCSACFPNRSQFVPN